MSAGLFILMKMYRAARSNTAKNRTDRIRAEFSIIDSVQREFIRNDIFSYSRSKNTSIFVSVLLFDRSCKSITFVSLTTRLINLWKLYVQYVVSLIRFDHSIRYLRRREDEAIRATSRENISLNGWTITLIQRDFHSRCITR